MWPKQQADATRTTGWRWLTVKTVRRLGSEKWVHFSRCLNVNSDGGEVTSDDKSFHIPGFPRLLESPGFFSLKFEDLESPGKSLWSWKVLKIEVYGLGKSWKTILENYTLMHFCSDFWHLKLHHISNFPRWESLQHSPRLVGRGLTAPAQKPHPCSRPFVAWVLFFFIFKHSWAPKRSWKISHGGPGKVLDFLPVKEWEPWYTSTSNREGAACTYDLSSAVQIIIQDRKRRGCVVSAQKQL